MEPLPPEQKQEPPPKVFWTSCPNCKLRHLYPSQHMGWWIIKCVRESCNAIFFANGDIVQETKLENCAVSPKKEDQNHSLQNTALASNVNIMSSCRGEVSPSLTETVVNFEGVGNSRRGNGVGEYTESIEGRKRFKELGQEGRTSDVEDGLPTEFENSTGRRKKAKQVVAADDGLESKLDQGMKSTKERKCSRELEQEGSSSDVKGILPTEVAKSKECKKKEKQVVSADDEGPEGANVAKAVVSSKAPAKEMLHKQKKRNKPEENKKTPIVKTSNCLLDKKTTTVPPKQKSCDDSTSVRQIALACHAAADSKEMGPDGCMGTIPSSRAHLEPETVFYNFENDRSSKKFKTGQMWALYCDLDDLPRYYVKVKNVISSPVFKMDIQWLESYSTPKGVIPFVDSSMPVCCGKFKVTCDQVFDDLSYFSHQLSCVEVGIDLYDIYPREGEVWALYKKFSASQRCSNLKKYGYYIAEVINVEVTRVIQVRVLQNVTGLKTVVEAINEAGECSFLTMPWMDLYRFSHQIPSFKLPKEKRGYLYGRWALDPKSIPDKSL